MIVWRRVFSERRRLIVPLLVVLAVNVAVLMLVVLPLQAGVNRDAGRANDVRVDLGNARRAERVANETRVSQERADAELEQFYSEVLPSDHAAARDLLFLRLRTLQEETGVSFATSRLEPEPVESSSLMRFRVDTDLTGDYADIREFLYGLETGDDFFIVESVKLGSLTAESETAGSLQLVLQVATYYTRAQR